MTERMRNSLLARHRREQATVENPLGEGHIDVGENNLTIAQIRNNPRLQDLFFNAHLNHLNPAMGRSIVDQMMEEPPKVWTEDQNRFLEEARLSFNKQMAMVRVVKEAITDAEIEEMASIDPRIQEILGQVEPAHASRVIKSQLDDFAARDPDGFKRLMENFRAAQTLRQHPRSTNAERDVRAALERTGLTEAQYDEATAGSDRLLNGVSAQTRENLAKRVRENMGFFATVIGNPLTFGYLKRNRIHLLERVYATERGVTHDHDRSMRAVSELLHGTLHPDTRIAIQRALRDGGTPEVRDDRNVVSLTDYKSVYDLSQREFSDAAIEKKHRAVVEAEARRLNKLPEQFTQAERDAIDEPFAHNLADAISAAKRERRASGLFATMLSWLFSKSVMEIRNKTRDHWNRVGAPATP